MTYLRKFIFSLKKLIIIIKLTCKFSLVFIKLQYLKISKKNTSTSFGYKILLSEYITNHLFDWKESEKESVKRIKFASFFFGSLYMILVLRLLYLAAGDFIEKSNLRLEHSYNRLDIVDRNNNLLAVNLPTSSLYTRPHRVTEPKLALAKLIKILPKLDAKKILLDLNTNKKFIWIKRDLSPDQHQKIYNLGLPGFEFEKEQKRIYPYGNLISHVIGYVGRDLYGLAGIEKYFDESLSGKNRIGEELKDNKLQLSVDIRVQNILSEELDRTIKKFKAKGASGIIVNPNNGEIIAMVSKPDFDPHFPQKSDPSSLFNMATQGVYEMGSAMKAITIAIGIDTNTTALNDAYDLTYMKVDGFQVKDYPRKLDGWHSLSTVFLKSSNIGVSQIILEIGRQKFGNYLKQLDMLGQLKIELPERARPLFRPPNKWTDIDLVTISYGYGMAQSPAHFMQAMIPMMNGGEMHPLTLLKHGDFTPIKSKRIFKKETSKDMQKLMRLTVSEGTAKKAEVAGYYIGGKTGTANVAMRGGYDKTRRISSCFGAIPASNPKFLIYISYNEPQGIKETFGFAGGGWVAAPSVSNVLSRLAALYGLPKPDENDPEIIELNNIEYKIND